MTKQLNEAEIRATAERMDAETEKLATKIKQDIIDYAEANIPDEYQVAFMISVAMTIGEAALHSTANSLEKYGDSVKAEAEMAMDLFGSLVMPEIVRLAKGLGKAIVVDDTETNETRH